MSTTIKNQFNIISKNTTFPINNDKITKYFYLFPKQNDELFGKNIMSNFYSTKYLFKKLEDFYVMMKNIIELNKEKLKKDVNRNNYIFNQSNYIFFNKLTKNSENDFNNLFNVSLASTSSKIISKINKDDDYVSKFLEIDGVFNCLSYTSNPFFMNLFEENYNGNDKDFFMDLFKTYNNIRQKILSVSKLKNNAGILSLEPFIKYDINTDSNKNEDKKENKNNGNTNNFSNSNFYNTGKNIYSGLSTKKGTVSPPAPPASPPTSPPTSPPASAVVPNKNTTNYSLLYKKKLNNVSQIYSENIHNIFNNLHENLQNIVSFDRERSLYEILLMSIEIDYKSLLFFYSFIESVKFKIIVDTSKQINTYIYDNIRLYKQYLPSFQVWKSKYVNENKLASTSTTNTNTIDEEGLLFNKTTEKFFKDWTITISGIETNTKAISNRKEKINKLNKGVKLVNKVLKKE
jgi:hypothetical protein